MSGLTADMSGEMRGYCLHWTGRMGTVTVADADHVCEVFAALGPLCQRIPSGMRAMPRVLFLRATGRWRWEGGPHLHTGRPSEQSLSPSRQEDTDSTGGEHE